jgi:hypothetical protein
MFQSSFGSKVTRVKRFTAVFGSVLAFALPALAYDTQIEGEFHGWDGNTVYELMDGTVIKQMNYHYHYHYAYDPEVVIYDCSGSMCKIHVKGGDDDEEVAIEILNGGPGYTVPQYVPVPQLRPVAPTPAPAPAPQPNGPVTHSIWSMICYATDGSTYDVVWQGKLQSLLVRRTGKTFVATYHGYIEQISPNAFKVTAKGYGRTLTAMFGGQTSSLHADRNSDGSAGATDTCFITGGSD